jgi:hypothetical protein
MLKDANHHCFADKVLDPMVIMPSKTSFPPTVDHAEEPSTSKSGGIGKSGRRGLVGCGLRAAFGKTPMMIPRRFKMTQVANNVDCCPIAKFVHCRWP